MTFIRNVLNIRFAALVSAIVFCESAVAQKYYEQTGDSYLAISGTSTLHDWTMTSKEGKFQADFELSSDGTPVKLNSLSVTVRGESLKSGHTDMDKNAYSTLSTDTYKSIAFNLTSSSIVGTKIQCSGNLTVAGITKQITVEAVYKVLANQSLLCSGTKKILMSDYEIDAPSFMFGTVNTGDEITVSFNVNLAPLKK